MKKNKLTITERLILTALVKNRDDYKNTSQIAQEAGISWNTAHTCLVEFEKRGWVEREGAGTTSYWKVIIQQ
jgi:DNA-binding IclR family transcriptional regulator